MRNNKVNFIEFLEIFNQQNGFITPPHHKQIAFWLEKIVKSQKKQGLLQAFRNAGKSYIIGIFCAYLLYLDSNLVILILSCEQTLSTKMVRNIKHIIQRHPLMEDAIPLKKEQWASDCFTINREKELRDPSVISASIYGNITGYRADVIICDDCEVPKNSDSAEKRENLRQFLSELEFILNP
ncbi:MAG: phage terminase large subunit, partial [Rickettsiales bacterium]|nr:phage terminase large subunit [Rickettsiales bacterium]